MGRLNFSTNEVNNLLSKVEGLENGTGMAMWSKLSEAKTVFDEMDDDKVVMLVYYNLSGKGTLTAEECQWLFGKNEARGISSGDIIGLVKNTMFNLSGAHAMVLPTQDAKPASGSFPGADGLETVWDKTQINKIAGIEEAANGNARAIDQTCFRSYMGEFNMNEKLWYGYYMYGVLGRPPGSASGEYYLLRVADAGKTSDGKFIIHQTAWSCMVPEKVFVRRIVTPNKNSYDPAVTEYGEWVNVKERWLGEAEYKINIQTINGVPDIFNMTEENAGGVLYSDRYAGVCISSISPLTDDVELQVLRKIKCRQKQSSYAYSDFKRNENGTRWRLWGNNSKAHIAPIFDGGLSIEYSEDITSGALEGHKWWFFPAHIENEVFSHALVNIDGRGTFKHGGRKIPFTPCNLNEDSKLMNFLDSGYLQGFTGSYDGVNYRNVVLRGKAMYGLALYRGKKRVSNIVPFEVVVYVEVTDGASVYNRNLPAFTESNVCIRVRRLPDVD